MSAEQVRVLTITVAVPVAAAYEFAHQPKPTCGSAKLTSPQVGPTRASGGAETAASDTIGGG